MLCLLRTVYQTISAAITLITMALVAYHETFDKQAPVCILAQDRTGRRVKFRTKFKQR